MIIWINGAYGSGKSSVAEAICKKLKSAHLYDPEQLGYFLWNNFPAELKGKENFQHIPIWREFNQKILYYMSNHYTGTIVVPMTIYRKPYFDEIIENLLNKQVEVKHFILSAKKQTIISRLLQRGEHENCWAAQHIDMCLKAFNHDIFGEIIDTDFQSIDEVATQIIMKSNCIQ